MSSHLADRWCCLDLQIPSDIVGPKELRRVSASFASMDPGAGQAHLEQDEHGFSMPAHAGWLSLKAGCIMKPRPSAN